MSMICDFIDMFEVTCRWGRQVCFDRMPRLGMIVPRSGMARSAVTRGRRDQPPRRKRVLLQGRVDCDATVTWLDRFREKYSGLRGSMFVTRYPLSV